MIKVECITCKGPYELDEKRLPPSGLKMRCPKCGAVFQVYPDGRVAEPPARKATMLGPGAVPPPPAPAPAAEHDDLPIAKKPGAPAPAPGRAPVVVAPPTPSIMAAIEDDLDLPAPRKAGGSPLDVDLPAPRAQKPAVPAPAPKPRPGSAAAALLDDDLPAPRGAAGAKPGGAAAALAAAAAEIDLPAPRAAAPAAVPARNALAQGLAAAAAAARPMGRPSHESVKPALADGGRNPFEELDADPSVPGGKKPSFPGVTDLPGRARGGGSTPNLDADLPAPRRAAAIATDLDVDLPAPRGKGGVPAASMDLDLPAPKGKGAPASGFDLDLPAPKGRGAAASGLDLDLPAPKGKGAAASGLDLDLPAPKGKGAAASGLDLDLPAPKGKGAAASGLDLDLPTPKAKTAAGGFDLDLPTPKAKTAAGGLDLDLPTPKARTAAGGLDLDLPAPKSKGAGGFDLDLPAPKSGGGGGVDLPGLRGAGGFDLDLPTPKAGGDVDLPQVQRHQGFADLPAPAGSADLPQLSPGGGAARGDLPAPRGLADLPVPRAGMLSEPPSAGAGLRSNLDLDLPPPRGGTLPAPQSGGGMDDLQLGSLRPPGRAKGHGELELPGAAEGGGDGMEFADIPQAEQAPEAGRAAGPSLAPTERAAGKVAPRVAASPTGARRSRTIPIAIVSVVTIAAAGGALSLTPYGPFGYYAIEQHLPGAGDPATVGRIVSEADALALRDTFSDASSALEQLADARRTMGLNRALLARSLVHESLFAVRFGDTSGATRAAAIRQRIGERGDATPDVALAIAADEVRLGHASAVGARVAAARVVAPSDPFVDLVEAEAALATGDVTSALQAFQAALEHGGGAAAQWGVARALVRGGADEAETLAAIEATLAAWPAHGDALAERARIHAAHGDDERATLLLERVVGAAPLEDGSSLVSYPSLRASAWTQLGVIHESRGRLHLAEQAFDEAIAADGTRVEALLGAGRVILGDRPADALTRFESVIERDDAGTIPMASGRTALEDARLGAARAMLELERVEEGKDTLLHLAEERPGDPDVLRWLGRAEEMLDEHEAAELHLREAITLAPSVFEGYLFLAHLYGDLHRDSDAVAVLDSARSSVAEGPAMREALGVYELGLNRLDAAVTELTRALELDPTLPGARFSLGVAHRRAGRLAEADAAFERLAAIDAGHPGLALERGMIFEARGESERAVTFYAEALEASPDDPELLLRLGAAQVGAGMLDEAEGTLDRVQRALPASAEAEHFVGRIAFARGNFPEALQHLDRAIELDATRAEFYVYAGWAALESGNLRRALERAEDAIERDPSQGDAYWIRGTVRLRLRQVRDALGDLEHALVLRPGRVEAIAAIGECYDQLRQLGPAIDAYTRAVAASDTHGEWWYHLGHLQLDADRAADATRSLSRAALLGDAMAARPPWLADAHRLLGDSLRLTGERASAIEHYQRYLEVAEEGAIDRAEVRSALMDLGAVPRD